MTWPDAISSHAAATCGLIWRKLTVLGGVLQDDGIYRIEEKEKAYLWPIMHLLENKIDSRTQLPSFQRQ